MKLNQFLLSLLVASTAFFGVTTPLHAQSDGTITRIDQWTSSSSPNSITQRVFGKPVQITGLNRGELMSVASNGLATTTSTSTLASLFGGLVNTITSTGDSISVSSPTGNVNLGLNLDHANHWTSPQRFEDSANGLNVYLANNGIVGSAGYFTHSGGGTFVSLADATYAVNATGLINTNSDYYIGGAAINVSHWLNDAFYPVASDFTTGSIVFKGSSTNFEQDNANFFWDDSNNRLGVGTNSPDAPIHVKGNATSLDFIRIGSSATNQYSSIGFFNSSNAQQASFGYGGTGVGGAYADALFFNANSKPFVWGTAGTQQMLLTGGKLNIGGSSTTSTKLHLSDATEQAIQINSSTDAGYLSSYQNQISLAINRDESDGDIFNSGKAAAAIRLFTANADSSIGFYTTTTNNANPTLRMLLDKSGKLRIADGGHLSVASASVGAPGSASAGQKIQMYGIPGTVAIDDYAIGIESGFMWNSVGDGGGYKWYRGNAGTLLMTLASTGDLGIGGTPVSNTKIYARNNNDGTQDIASFVANNETLGVGIWYGGIRAIGSSANASLVFEGKGTGSVSASTFGVNTTNRTHNGATNLMAIAGAKNNAYALGLQNQLVIADTTAQAIGTGGGLMFTGLYIDGDSGSFANSGSIQSWKESATSATFGFSMLFRTRDNGGSGVDVLKLHSNGRIGTFGFIDPVSLFEIAGSQETSSIKAGSIEIQSYSVNNAWFGDNIYYKVSDSNFKYRANGYGSIFRFNGADFTFETAPSGTAGNNATMTTRLTIGNTGSVGIGRAPALSLAVGGSFTGSGLVHLQNDSVSGYSAFDMYDSGAAYVGGFGYANASAAVLAGKVFLASNAKDIVFTKDSGTSVALNINGSTGNVGVATTTPGAQLTVATGDVYIASSTRGIILKSPDGTCARGTIDNSDVLTFSSVTCP